MNAQPLYVKRNDEYVDAQVWYCSECRCVSRTEDAANRCCEPRLCGTCNQPLKKNYGYCEPCHAKKTEADRLRRIKNAKRCDPSENVDCWYDGDHNKYLLGDFADAMDAYDDEESTPEVLYFCKEHRVKLDADWILENAEENAELEDFEWGLNGASLQAVLDQWVAEHASHIRWFTEDYSRCTETKPISSEERG